ncbi:hypothetical protein [Paenibacillus physcomitrellae]|uniref:DUF2269 family protein n=1 Tax=Paenibacillus physcomitrellae TaxID=1619311 RepID=A0ABQ1GQZ0_9BACL|nr:hypothetical protein [Paenibacillus physcomitrellae]GGA48696.1 hypothetical protein GCM10010917_37450 [Paenibacillus physcomitrellae]
MFKVIMFLHILGSLALGFYLVLPFVVGGISRLTQASREGVLNIIRSLNRFAQYGLVLQLLTGIYLVFQGDYSMAWTTVVGILFIIAGGLSGMLGKPLRLAKTGEASSAFGKIRSFSSLLAIVVLVLSFFMVYRHII